jgi:hypothetical protein
LLTRQKLASRCFEKLGIGAARFRGNKTSVGYLMSLIAELQLDWIRHFVGIKNTLQLNPNIDPKMNPQDCQAWAWLDFRFTSLGQARLSLIGPYLRTLLVLGSRNAGFNSSLWSPTLTISFCLEKTQFN